MGLVKSRLRRDLTILLGLAVFLLWPSPGASGEISGSPIIEIREYQGEKLGSTHDFRENSIRGIQRVDIRDYHLVIDGLTDKKIFLTYDELQKKPHTRKLVQIHCVEGWSVTALWEGVSLRELFRIAGPKAQANTVIFHSVDGYTTSLPLKYVLERDLIIADKINRITLPAAQGFPYILVAETKWGYKWSRWIRRIELSDNTHFQGYWEKQGYSNDGDLQGPIFGR